MARRVWFKYRLELINLSVSGMSVWHSYPGRLKKETVLWPYPDQRGYSPQPVGPNPTAWWVPSWGHLTQAMAVLQNPQWFRFSLIFVKESDLLLQVSKTNFRSGQRLEWNVVRAYGLHLELFSFSDMQNGDSLNKCLQNPVNSKFTTDFLHISFVSVLRFVEKKLICFIFLSTFLYPGTFFTATKKKLVVVCLGNMLSYVFS